MSDLYDDAAVHAVAKSLWAETHGPADEWADLAPSFRAALLTDARAILDAVAPAIAARALRQAAGAIFNGATDPEQEFYDAGVSPWLMRRADEIEAGQ